MMKKLQVFCVVAAIVMTVCIGNVHAIEVSGITDADNDWGDFNKLKNLVELKYGDQDNDIGHWEMGLRKKHHGFKPLKKHADYYWVNSEDPNTWADNGHAHKDKNRFSFEFTQATGEVVFTLGWSNHRHKNKYKQRQMTYQYDEYAGRGMDELHIMARKGKPDKHGCSMYDLKLNDELIMAELVGEKKNTFFKITELGCGDFTLSGYIKMGWPIGPGPGKPKKNEDIEALFAFGPPCEAAFWFHEGNIETANAGSPTDPWALKFISKAGETPLTASLVCDLPANFTFDEVDMLSADYARSEGDLQVDSPRFSLMMDKNEDGQVDPNDKPVSIHWGQTSGIYNKWFNTGNIYDSNDLRIDLTQFGYGTDLTLDEAKALIGDMDVLQVSVIVDGYGNGDQVIYIDNIKINTYLYDTQPLVLVGDFNNDYQVGSVDLHTLASNWLRTDCLPDPNVCQNTDIAPVEAPDGRVDLADFATFAENWLLGIDAMPPTPDPMTFATPPTTTGPYSITMTAEEAEDYNGVEYYFHNFTNPFHDSGWQPSPVYEDTGLYPLVNYVYKVKVRDISERRNETAYSDPDSATTEWADISPPAPDPPSWNVEPTVTGPYSISMKANECTDESGVQYYFYAYDSDDEYDPNNSSGWQDSPSYTATDLAPNTTYYFWFNVRDKSSNYNHTGFAGYRSATTGDGDDTLPPIPDTMSWDQAPVATGENSITMTATQASDGSGVEYYFDCTIGGGNDSSWQDSRIYEDTGLVRGTEYTYKVKARDKSLAQNENGWSSEYLAQTLSDAIPPDPVTWEIEPRSIGAHTIIMTAEISAEPGVQYYFDNITVSPDSDPNHDSGWQDSEFYEDAGLDPNTTYEYKLKIRDTDLNETDCLIGVSATTAFEGAPQILELISVAGHDGRVWGTATASIYYNAYDATYMALRVGGKPTYGYRSIVSFDSTRSLPTKTEIQIVSANLELTCGYHAFFDDSYDPFLRGGECYIDIASIYDGFSNAPVLDTEDWDHLEDIRNHDIAIFNPASAPPVGTTMTSGNFDSYSRSLIDRNGITQLRFGFEQVTLDPTGYVGFYSGETPNKEPKLIILYTD